MTEPKKPSAFTTIAAISSTRPLRYRDLTEQGAPYEPFLVNRAFSLCEDATIAASLMNTRSHLPKDMQATFFIHALRPRKRFEKWPKALDDEDTRTVATYYGMTYREAKTCAGIHTTEQYAVMREVLSDGATPSRYR